MRRPGSTATATATGRFARVACVAIEDISPGVPRQRAVSAISYKSARRLSSARYHCAASNGTVTIDTLESNLWGPGSGWRYEIVPAAQGTDLHVSLTRVPNSLKGRLVAALIPVAGPHALGKQFQSVLRRAESR